MEYDKKEHRPLNKAEQAARDQKRKEQLAAQAEKINALADKLVTGKLNATKKQITEMQLIQELKKYKGYADIDSPQSATGTYDQNAGHYYDPLLFFQIYRAALTDYADPEKGKDSETGVKLTFAHLFNKYYKVKEPDIYREAAGAGENTDDKEKRKYLRGLLNGLRKKYGSKGLPTSYNVYNKDKITAMLQEIGASDEEIAWYFGQMANANTTSIYIKDGDGKERENPDITRRGNHEVVKENAVILLYQLLQLALAEEKSKTLRQNMVYYFTMKFAAVADQLELESRQLVIDKIDQQYLVYYLDAQKQDPEKNDEAILAEYLGKEYNSVRKNLRLVEKRFLAAVTKRNSAGC